MQCMALGYGLPIRHQVRKGRKVYAMQGLSPDRKSYLDQQIKFFESLIRDAMVFSLIATSTHNPSLICSLGNLSIYSSTIYISATNLSSAVPECQFISLRQTIYMDK
jgi:hypothetical protein